MTVRAFGLLCLLVGHRRSAESRHSVNGNIFGKCVRCSRELFRDPVTGNWRAATDQDRKPRGFTLIGEAVGTSTTAPAAKKLGAKSRRSSSSRR